MSAPSTRVDYGCLMTYHSGEKEPSMMIIDVDYDTTGKSEFGPFHEFLVGITIEVDFVEQNDRQCPRVSSRFEK